MNVERVTIKYDGQFYEFPVAELDVNPQNPPDTAVMNAVMGQLGINSLPGFVVDPPESERFAGQHDTKTVINIRPTATYG